VDGEAAAGEERGGEQEDLAGSVSHDGEFAARGRWRLPAGGCVQVSAT
jgi:hypothetical protein